MGKRGENTNYWQSYSDMMAALLLIFVLIIAVAFVQMKNQEANLKRQEESLREQREKMEENEKLLEQQRNEYIRLKKQLLEAQAQLDKIIGIKAEIIASLKEQFKEKNLEITLDPKTGAIRFQSEILFDTNKSNLLPQGEQYLEKFIPAYFEVLLQGKYSTYISEIIVEGNCDSRGSYEDNLVLSQDRAKSVALYSKKLLEKKMNNKELDQVLKLLNINGRSNKNVIYGSDHKENLDASRRVEIKFRLKDEEMIEEMLKIMEGKQ